MSQRHRTARGLQPTADSRESHDTICALATSPGIGSIAVIRISGRKTLAVLDRVFQGPKPSRQPSQTVRLGWMLDAERKPLDQVLLTVFRRPKSYTGEDMAEVSCHGGSVTASLILDVLRRHGCRDAEPGEFTRRAVLAGKLSLSQAEAILDLVNARTPAAHRDALARYSGRLSQFIADIKAMMEERLAEIEYLLSIDEDRAEPVRGTRTGVDRIVRVLDRAIAAAGQNRYLHSGARVAIIGRPNVGKSSLFNRLLGIDRAIVNSRPGTTRDRVDASITIGDVVVRLEDTAGITSRGASRLTRLAAEQTRGAVEQADLIVAVFDGSRPAQSADHEVIMLAGTRPAICVINKNDLPQRLAPATLSIVPGTRSIGLPVVVSCRTGSGISRLRQLLGRRLRPSAGKGPAAGERALAVLRESRAALERSREAPNLETAALEIRAAIDMLAQVDAPVTGTDILERVFARFCVGK